MTCNLSYTQIVSKDQKTTTKNCYKIRQKKAKYFGCFKAKSCLLKEKFTPGKNKGIISKTTELKRLMVGKTV